MTTCCSLSLSAADNETLPTELRWSDCEARNPSRSMAKLLGFWEQCKPKSEYEILGSKKVMLTLRSWEMCHYVIWNTGIMSRRTSSSIIRKEEVWLPHYMQSHPETNIFQDTPTPLPLLPVCYHPNLSKKLFQLQSLRHCSDSPFCAKIQLTQFASVIFPCCAQVDCI